ncbi:MAG: hypothetical protein DA408_14280 [Bacteroidetes bacterium]|nr:MAG: hypothetical protein C7N36_09500 [Bacteroidota bacterium]PTM11137.1 MAG: hypothetical protein DA408_14280 [Bacteroidota bacterium]
MMMRIIATCLFLTFSLLVAQGQREVPLTGNRLQESQYATELPVSGPAADALTKGFEKATCGQPEAADVIPVIAGLTNRRRLELDTVGLGSDGFYACVNCATLTTGTAFIPQQADGTPKDSLIFTANAAVTVATEAVLIQYCNTDGTTCGPATTLTFLVRRPGENNFPPAILIGQEETLNLTVTNDLPGALACSFFVNCPDKYEGREQLAYLTDYSQPVASFVYRSSRIAGLDSLCLVLCDTNGICDTTHYAFRINVPSFNPPVYDDFSYSGPAPARGLWLDREVYINNTLAIAPPSLGVATFDGLDYRGRPYGDGYGEADRLTSTYLDTDTGDWMLSFWLQRGGIADRPERQDSMIVQFRDDNDEWVSVASFAGVSSSTPLSFVDDFAFYAIPVTEAYRHSRFQFRFVNNNDRLGAFDNWHLDYVRLDNNPTQSPFFNDIAFTQQPDFLLKNYTSLPWRHFQPQLDNELNEYIVAGIYNHFSATQNVSPSTVQLLETNTGINPFGTPLTLFNGLEINVENGVPLNRSYSLMGDPTGFSDVWDAYVATMAGNNFAGIPELAFQLAYNFQNTSQDNLPFVARNDATERTTVFSNYFSYDDGTAETALETSPGKQVAIAYTAGVADSLQGVRLFFPHTNANITGQEFRLQVWIGELDDTPDYNISYQADYASNYYDTLQGFTSYPLVDAEGLRAPLAIPAGTFYVGWEQVTNCTFGRCVGVGYDRNRPQGKDFIYAENGSGWEAVAGVGAGALMLRPVMSGGELVLPTSVNDVVAGIDLTVFPNPGRDQIFLRTDAVLTEQATTTLFNSAGQLVLRQAFAPSINVGQLPAGMYWLQVVDANGNQSVRQRLIILK